jgi:exopolysaccharide biosynthesis polyprenyl glycosylphosphotransferase
MQLHRRHLLLKVMQLFDVTAIVGAMMVGAIGYSHRTSVLVGDILSLRLTVANLALATALLLVCHFILRANNLYESRRLSTIKDEAIDIVKAVTVCTVVFAIAAVAFKLELATSRWFLTVFWAVLIPLLVGSRIVLRSALASLRRKGHNLRQVLIVGTNTRAAQLAGGIEGRPELGYSLLGFADDAWPGGHTIRRMGYPVVSDLANLPQFLNETVVDEVFICLPLKSFYEHTRTIVERCEDQGIIVRMLGQFFDLRSARTRIETFNDGTVVSVYTGQMEGWPVLAKRAFDIAASFALLVLFSPVFVITAAAIKLSSDGPVFFSQERVGISKRRFRLFKFRTMVADAESRQQLLRALNEASGPVFKIRNDPRVTPLGQFLRKTSIDELPQLINVLKGDMSLVGPRPLPICDYNGFEQDSHRRRFSVRPGITCLWQVNGRSNIHFDRWMELDMEYIDQWSLWLDLKILMKTVPAVIRGSGAA